MVVADAADAGEGKEKAMSEDFHPKVTAEQRGHLMIMSGPASVRRLGEGVEIVIAFGEHEVAIAPPSVTHVYGLVVRESCRPMTKVHVGTGHVTVFGTFREVVEALYP